MPGQRAHLLMGLAKPPAAPVTWPLRSGVASAEGTPSSSERSSCAYAPLFSSRSGALGGQQNNFMIVDPENPTAPFRTLKQGQARLAAPSL